ncbi:MAG: ferredoxin family protein [Armatimonadetes bacterium]|nr:ferredoxin family protein [Armatimonadota bacterium]MDE2205131.1 ferredoxin family protein [Armatimonadota bacterium]
MAYVITEPCIGVKDRSCIDVCPVDCIHEGVHEVDGAKLDMLFIDPKECIDCGLCEPECPVTAIFADSDVPEQFVPYIGINADFFLIKK